MATGQLELEESVERLTLVERVVLEMKRQLPPQTPDEEPWYLKHAGKFRDDPDFQEIIRLGREIRNADRPS